MIVGLLPMGGAGVRLGQPVPKPLMPTITDDGIVPLYRHALEQLHRVTDRIVTMVTPESCSCVRRIGLPVIETTDVVLAGAFGLAGRVIADAYGADALVVMAFPDSIWQLDPGASLSDAIAAVRGDGALALFDAGADELDEVLTDGPRVTGVVTKVAGASGRRPGWGAFVIRAEALATFTSNEKDGPQLGRLDMGWAHLGSYVDLGTPERYIRAHDQRTVS